MWTDGISIYGVRPEALDRFRSARSAAESRYMDAVQFSAERGECILLPGADGALAAAVMGFGAAADDDTWLAGKLPGILPEGEYHFSDWPADVYASAVAFGLGNYRFGTYNGKKKKAVSLRLPQAALEKEVHGIVDAVSFGRDLVNTPASDLGPDILHEKAEKVARDFGGTATAIVGDALLKHNFQMIHAVGKASAQAPRLLDLRFGNPAHPKITLVGKGVCFDTGGLDIKPSSAMLLMKKDMGGAAAALAAAMMIRSANLPVYLRVLLPIVENAIAGNAFRPGDVLISRKGLTVEIGNTDAEGRLILADALTYASEDNPDLLIDYATLTGAARVALGPDLPPFYTYNDGLASEIIQAGMAAADPVWRMPLWPAYANMIESKIADMNNSGGSPFAGSITAALFLSRFIGNRESWAHFDIYAWNPSARPGRPEGGEVQAARMTYELLKRRYGSRKG